MSRTFTVRHEIACTPEQFWERIHNNPAFNQELYVEKLEYQYELLEDDRETGKRRAHIVPKVNAPLALRKALGDSVAFDENGQFSREGETSYTFDIIPGVMASKIKIGGRMTCPPSDEGTCYRVVDFEVGCSIFGIGGLFEKFVSKEVQARYEDSAEFTNTFLKKHYS
jgi:hypothetical protein